MLIADTWEGVQVVGALAGISASSRGALLPMIDLQALNLNAPFNMQCPRVLNLEGNELQKMSCSHTLHSEENEHITTANIKGSRGNRLPFLADNFNCHSVLPTLGATPLNLLLNHTKRTPAYQKCPCQCLAPHPSHPRGPDVHRLRCCCWSRASTVHQWAVVSVVFLFKGIETCQDSV